MSLTFASAAADYLLEHGPLSLQQLHALGLERGVTKARGASSLRQSLDSARFVLRPDGRYDTAARLLAGAVFTTRVRRPPSEGVLWASRDLDPLLPLRGTAGLPLLSGGEMGRGEGSAECWVGPEGWLPDVAAGELVGLRWDGRQITVEAVRDIVGNDSPAAQDVRRLLARHATRRHRGAFGYDVPTALTAVVLSARVEDPHVFDRALPPLSELLPLPEDLRPQDTWGGASRFEPGTVLQVPLPDRVHRELGRRADLLGERLPDYVAMLLGAAADRLLPPAPGPRPAYDGYADYDGPADVVELSRWSR